MGLFGKGFSAQKGLDFLLGGYGGLDRRRAIDTQEKYQSQIDANGTPQEQIAYAFAPEKLGEAYASRYGARNVGAGDLLINGPDGRPIYNPKTFVANDTIYNTSANGGAPSQVGTVAPSFSDETARMNAVQPEYRSVGEGQTLYAIPKVGAGDGAVAPPQMLGAAPQQGTLAQRNNNPGNLRPDGSNWQGMTGQNGGFVQFDTPENGQRAARINLANQARLHGINTLSGLISKYAPAADGNDPQAYIATVARQTGIDPNQPIDLTDPAVQDKILPAMFAVEGGGTPSPQQAITPPRLASGPQAIVQGAPKRTARPATAEEKAAYRISADIPAQIKPDGSIDVVSGVGAAQKPLPASVLQEYKDNLSSSREIDRALKLVQSQPKALGALNAIPFYSRFDENGTDTRNAVGNIGSLIVHERAGASATASEIPRLKPFIPEATDPPEVARHKLQMLKTNIDAMNQAALDTYGPDTGYRSLADSVGASKPQPVATQPKAQIPRKANSGPVRVSTPQEAMALAPGTIFITPDGKRKVR